LPSWASDASDPWTDLGLTLPIFLGYHLGVVLLPVRNAADFVTSNLVRLASHSLLAYAGLTLAICAMLVGALVLVGRGKKLSLRRFATVALEGVVYAALMKVVAGLVVGSLRLGGGGGVHGPFAGLVMSLGAGFYEEVAFRVVLFGLGLRLIQRLTGKRGMLAALGWAAAAAFVFSAWHYVGRFGDPFELRSFVFRWVCGLAFTAMYRLRGFAPVVWAHALYDVWVLAL
jgi:hypothetical protein